MKAKLKEQGILVGIEGERQIRLVTHLWITDQDIEHVIQGFKISFLKADDRLPLSERRHPPDVIIRTFFLQVIQGINTMKTKYTIEDMDRIADEIRPGYLFTRKLA